jgi:hypothetical protein
VARVTANVALSFLSLPAQVSGTLIEAGPTKITYGTAARKAVYEGQFSYGAENTASGPIRSYTEFRGSNVALRIEDLNDPVIKLDFIPLETGGVYTPGYKINTGWFSGNDSFSGSDFKDALAGYDGNDTLQGRGGDDLLVGRVGTDTAVFAGNRADYTITRKADGAFTVADKVANRDGTDTLRQIEQLQFSDQTITVWAALPFPDLFAANLSQAKAIASAYQTLLGGIPGISGFDFLIKANLTSNFGASPSVVFNDENIFINVVNALVQGNAEATSKFSTLAAGTTLSAKITSLYQSIIPVAKQSADGIAFFTRPDGLKFYQDVAKERGITAENGPAVIALASILKVAVDGKIGIGNPVSDLVASIADGSSGLPAGSATVLQIETIDGTKFDADDASDALPGFSGLAPAPAALIGIIADTGVMF